jgi:hypothetical protein
MIIDPWEEFVLVIKDLKEKGIGGILVVLGFLLIKTGEILSYSKKEEGKKDKEKGGDKDEEERNI